MRKCLNSGSMIFALMQYKLLWGRERKRERERDKEEEREREREREK
jgi:hypothetical protein